MLNHEDRRAIEGLFDRLAEAEHRAPNRDREAEDLIGREIARQPAAPYYMAQTILVQQTALEAAEKRIEELESQARQAQRGRSPWDRQADDGYNSNAGYQRGGWGGGGFLGGAMQTALGVAGGVLLGSAIGSLLGAGGAHAAQSQNNDQPDQATDNPGQQDQGQDQGADQNSGDDAGGNDWGDFGGGDGGFDLGGDF